MIGERIGSYTIVEKLGEGGMGVVYRATDARLHRDVALKIIPEALAKDPQIMGRFEREAQMLAALNHPNIAAIYGIEEAEGRRALVMELASGEELATRLAIGRIPLDETLRIALAIAEALEAAHDRGIIHRDLKPSNVKLGSPSDSGGGRVKILDFGLAKALEGDLAASGNVDITTSGTISVAATQAGTILGTASYMSPEQARALPADRRADIWSFGVLLYEMLAGKRAFRGDTVADTIARVLEREPDYSALPPETPPAVRALIERCLVKTPRQRLQAIGDARLVIEETRAGLVRPLSAEPLRETAPSAPAPSVPAAPPGGRGAAIAPWVLTAVAVAVAVGAVMRSRSTEPIEPPLVVDIALGDEDEVFDGLGASFALSSDGRTLAYVEGDNDSRTLYVRALDSAEPRAATAKGDQANGPYNPFFSPDGAWIGYATVQELRRVPVTGGSPLTICKVLGSRGATWLPDDTIVFTDSQNTGLTRMPARGGAPQALTTVDVEAGETSHRWPQALPDGKHVLFTSGRRAGNFDQAAIEVVSLANGERKEVHRGGSYARYVPTGHLVFVSEGTMFAIGFDLARLETKGSPVPLHEDVASDAQNGGAQFDFSRTGRFVYMVESKADRGYPAVWVDRDGGTSALIGEPGIYANPRFSPDGGRLSLTVLHDENWDIWVYDIARGVSTRLTFDPGIESEQVWSPDGQSLIFSSDRAGADSLYRKSADGSGDVERLTEAKFAQWSCSWSRDGRYLSFIDSRGQYDIHTLDLTSGESTPWSATEFAESYADISPNGRFLAYSSNESGSYQIYVRPFPAGDGKWQVSVEPGVVPRWRGDGRELFWRTADGIDSAAVETHGATFRAERPQPAIRGHFEGGMNGVGAGGFTFADYDVSPDGKRFVMFADQQAEGEGGHRHVTLLTRWFDRLKSLEGLE